MKLVLILVLVDHALGACVKSELVSKVLVLILVLVDHALGDLAASPTNGRRSRVLILVLVDHALGVEL